MQPKSQAGRTLFWLVLVSALPLAGCGCTGTPTGGAVPRPYEGRVVRVACPGDPPAAVVGRYGRAWAAREGVELQIVPYDPLTGLEAGPPADAWVVPAADMPRWAAAGQLLPVPGSCTTDKAGYAWEGLLPLYREKLLVWDRTAYALPLVGAAPLCFYRDDLLADARHQEAFEKIHGRKLAPPATWEEFETIASYFHGVREVFPGGTSLPPLPEQDDDLDREFYGLAAPFARRAVHAEEQGTPADEMFSFHYDKDTMRPRIDTPGFVYALKTLQRLQECRPPGSVREPAETFQRGGAVLCLADASWIGRFQRGKESAVRGKVGFCRVPDSRGYFDYKTGKFQVVDGVNAVSYLGSDGWLAVVPRGAAQPEAAFALLAELSDPQTSRKVVIEPEWGGGAFRSDHLANSAGWSGFGLDTVRTDSLIAALRQTLTHPGVKNPVLRLRTPDARPHQRIVDEQVRAALTGKQDAATALSTVARRWRELDERRDLKTRRAEYLLSLRLQPPR